ncbi:MAG: hypothetical protein IKI09_10675 [Bacteroidales bacterium]|nr:hypothetical protein [Bacteroidales bacterium]
MTKKNSLKAIALSLGLAAMLLPANNLAAQDGGLFCRGASADNETVNNRGLININLNTEDGITNGNFGDQPAPLGSGLVLLIGAGLGYVALKKKEDEQ